MLPIPYLSFTVGSERILMPVLQPEENETSREEYDDERELCRNVVSPEHVSFWLSELYQHLYH